jgi:hypothetical protein
MRLKVFAAFEMLLQIFWFLSGFVGWAGTNVSGLLHTLVHIETLMMGYTINPETLVPDQTATPGKNSKMFIQITALPR